MKKTIQPDPQIKLRNWIYQDDEDDFLNSREPEGQDNENHWAKGEA